MPERQLCIHGHFYQPPREDPWLGRILIEQSAAPMRHWNERIVAESYGPMGWAHRLGNDGRIIEILNCYEWISFNAGPTLMHWMQRRAPEVYARILEGDAASVARWGHGNAIGQVYHHCIMPLADELDRELEIAWAMADFSARFGRRPEGMWLAECAVDAKTLEDLARYGISFVILSPHQARAVVGSDGQHHTVHNGEFDKTKPYRVDLPSGASLAAFFYDGPVSQSIAFEGLLQNGEQFWQRLNRAAAGGMLLLATDGETYGHHVPFGEMALAYVLAQARNGRDGLGLINPSACLAANPPVSGVLLHEPSSWSCAHGIERWRSDCGCKDGGHREWNQRWRGPLRDALVLAKEALNRHFFHTGASCFKDPHQALVAYGRVLANPETARDFAFEHIRSGASEDTAWQLLAMQEQALAAFASCAWFFDDISRIEPVNAMTFMVRAMELAVRSGGQDMSAAFEEKLNQAVSNKAEEGTGATILRNRVLPRRQDTASLTLLALLLIDMEGKLPGKGDSFTVAWPAFSLQCTIHEANPATRRYSGTLHLGTVLERKGESAVWLWEAPSLEDSSGHGSFMHERKSSITVTCEGAGAVTKTLGDLPRHVRDYVAFRSVAAKAEQDAPRNKALARHVLSLMDTWEEAQHSMPHAWLWLPLASHILLACTLEEDVPEDRREQALRFIDSLEISYSMREAGWKMTERVMLGMLAEPLPDWHRLAVLVRRAARVFPERNLWALRNAFWQRRSGAEAEEALREALGFQ